MPGTTPGRLVAVDLPAGPDLMTALDAVWAAGDAALPLPGGLQADARTALLSTLRPSALVDGSGTSALPGGEPVPEGAALVLVTSGSTSRPKGVVLAHGALEASARATAARIGEHPDDRWLCCLPLSHVAGLQILVRARLAGREPILQPRFDPASVAAATDATLVSVVPTMLLRLLEAGVDLSRFRVILVGGAAPPPGLLARARAAGAHLVLTYGMTETCGGCVYDGVPLDGVDVSLATDGRIRIRGPVLLDGYRGDPSPPVDEDGWFTTGDIGRWSGDRLEVRGRADDLIITGGENVVPGDVEAVLAEHPAVAEVAVIGQADPEWGQRVVAVVVPVGEPPTLDELRDHARARLPRHAAPRSLRLVEELPLLDSGKVDRQTLRVGLPRPERR